MPRDSGCRELNNEAEEGGWRAMLRKMTRENLSDTVTFEQIFKDERNRDLCGYLGQSNGCVAGRSGVRRGKQGGEREDGRDITESCVF